MSFIQKEASHVEGFAPELAVVTKGTCCCDEACPTGSGAFMAHQSLMFYMVCTPTAA